MLHFKIRTSTIIQKRALYAAVNYDAPYDPNLTKSDVDLLSFLSLMSGKKGYCWPSVNYLCIGLHLDPVRNRRNIRRRLSKLEALGYIRRDAQYHTQTSGRQTSNRIYVNYISSVNEFTLPRNSYLPKKEKIYKKEKRVIHQRTYPQVTKVYGWKLGNSGGTGFGSVRSKSLLRGLARYIHKQNTSKWKYLLAENMNLPLSKPTGGKAMKPTIDDDLDDLFTLPAHRMPAPPQIREQLSTISVDKPVHSTPGYIVTADDVGKVSWKDICAHMNRLNDQFQHWQIRLYMSGLNGHTLELFAELPYFRDTCQHRFGEDLLRACKKLGYPVKFVKIKLRNE